MKRSQCNQCLRPTAVCYCHTITKLSNQWPVHIIQHPNEAKHAIGTARIAQLSLHYCITYITRQIDSDERLTSLCSTTQPLLVYPAEDSTPLAEIDTHEVRPLIFLDGSWKKTRRMIYESSHIQSLEKISFNPDTPSRYRIRKEPNESSISTLEAIVMILEKLENQSEKYQPLLTSMDWMINKQIEYMGRETFEKNYR